MGETLVLGLGNVLLGDEGVGVRVIERLLERYDFPEGVQVMDGGNQGLYLLPYVEDATRLVVVDAVQARKPPGTLVRLTGDEIPVFLDVASVINQYAVQGNISLGAGWNGSTRRTWRSSWFDPGEKETKKLPGTSQRSETS